MHTYAFVDFFESRNTQTLGDQIMRLKFYLDSFSLARSNIKVISFEDYYIALSQEEI